MNAQTKMCAGALKRAKSCVRIGKTQAPLFDTALWVSDQEVGAGVEPLSLDCSLCDGSGVFLVSNLVSVVNSFKIKAEWK
jgi:hypothetical protein